MKRPLFLLLVTGCSTDPAGGPLCEEPSAPGGHWESVPPPPATVAPASAHGLVTAWTGDELLIWGRPGATKLLDGEELRPNAAAYSPQTRQWRDITPYGSAQAALQPGAAWTGTEWILWSGEISTRGGVLEASDSGVRLDPATGDWHEMAPAPIEARSSPLAVWTGREVVFWGGVNRTFGIALDGAAYDPSTDTWRVLGIDGFVVPSDLQVVPRGLWTGTRILIWSWPRTGGPVTLQYDPESDQWSPMSTEGAAWPSGGSVWTGQELLAWGYNNQDGYVAGGAYDPERGLWRTLSFRGAPVGVARIWADRRMLTWGGDLANDCRVGGAYDVASDTWTTFTSQGAPSFRYGHTLTWTGHSMLVFGGKGGDEGRWDQWQGGEFFPDW